MLLFWALPSLLLAAQQRDVPLAPDSTVSPAETVSPLEFARIAGQIELLSAQLNAQYELTGQTLDTINTIITVSAAAISILIFVLGIFGYRNLRSELQSTLEAKIDEQLPEYVSDKVDDFLADKERTWDDRFTDLFRRVTRLSEPRQ